MRIFNTLALELTATCNRSCVFCPVSVYKRPEGSLPRALVLKASEELRELKYRGRVEFYIYNEPLKNREELYYALEVFRTNNPKITLMISTNGDYLKGPEDIKGLYDKGLNQIVINAYTSKQYPKFKSWVEQCGLDQSKSPYKPAAINARICKVLDKSDSGEFGKGVHSLQNRAGSIPEFLPVPKEPLSKMCVKPFRLLNINWEGEALVCCNDYYGDVEIGNLADSSLLELWNSPVMNTYRSHLLVKTRDLPLCRSCDCHSGAYPHLVDDPSPPYAKTRDVNARYEERLNDRTTH